METIDLFAFYLSGKNWWYRKRQSFQLPCLYVRTANRNGDSLQPKSLLIIPGHLDPQFGTERTEGPTVSWDGCRKDYGDDCGEPQNMSGTTHDIGAAFRGYVDSHPRPSGGLPSVGQFPEIRHGQLLQILKGAYGLMEAPRLWYLRARGS